MELDGSWPRVSFTRQTYVNVPKYRNQSLRSLWPAFLFSSLTSFFCRLFWGVTSSTYWCQALLIVPMHSGMTPFMSCIPWLQDHELGALFPKPHLALATPRTQGYKQRLKLRQVRWGYISLFKQHVNNLRRIAEHFSWQDKEISLSCQLAQI